MYPVVVLCGGLGTRVASVTNNDIPKILIEVDGHPFIEFKLAGLAAQGARQAILLTGFLGNMVDDYVSGKQNFGISVSCFEDGEKQLGTAGAIRRVLDELPAVFWVTYGDTYLQFDAVKAEELLMSTGCDALMTVLRNSDAVETSNISLDGNLVAKYDKPSMSGTHEFIDYGMLLFRKDCFTSLPVNEPIDLASVVGDLIQQRRVAAFEVDEWFHDIGNRAVIEETEKYFVEHETWKSLTNALPK